MSAPIEISDPVPPQSTARSGTGMFAPGRDAPGRDASGGRQPTAPALTPATGVRVPVPAGATWTDGSREPAGAGGVATATTTGQTVLRRIAYPVLLVSVVAAVTLTLANKWDLGYANMFFLVWTVSYLAVLERLIPYERNWHPTAREWGIYGFYFLLTMVGSALAQLPVMAIVSAVATADPALPIAMEIPLAALLGSLASYTVHRLGHTNRWLWKLHGVHHVPQKVNVANNSVNHVADVVLAQGAVQLSLALVGFSEPAVFAVGIFVIAQGYFTHANADVRIGWLNHIFASPEQHRLHHSTDLSEAGHYGSELSVWDRLFGSFTWYPGRTPVGIGLVDPTSFPPTGALWASLLHPVRRRRPASG